MAPRGRLTTRIVGAYEGANKQLAKWLDNRFREEIEAEKWPYPTEPKVRDIVNTGRLKNSQSYSQSSDGSITFTWSAPYATQVHEGGTTLEGVRFPGRPWTRAPLAELPAQAQKLFSEELRRPGGGG